MYGFVEDTRNIYYKLILKVLFFLVNLFIVYRMYEISAGELFTTFSGYVFWMAFMTSILLGYDIITNSIPDIRYRSKSIHNFIVVEGIDGSGKSTVVDSIKSKFYINSLSGRLEIVPSLPSNTTLSKTIRGLIGRVRSINQLQILGMYTASIIETNSGRKLESDTYVTNDGVSTAVKEKKLVVADRWLWSTRVYAPNILENKMFRKIGKFLDMVQDVITMPRLVVYVRTNPDLAHNRTLSRGDEKDFFTDIDKLRIYSKRYDKLLLNKSYVYVIENNGSPEEFKKKVEELITFLDEEYFRS